MTLMDRIAADLAKTQQEPQTTEVMTRLFLVDSKYRLDAVFDSEWPDPRLKDLHAIASTLAGMCAYLLDQMHQLDQDTATDVAWQLHDWSDDGEGCADWVAQEVRRRGIGHLVAPVSAGESPSPSLRKDDTEGERP